MMTKISHPSAFPPINKDEEVIVPKFASVPYKYSIVIYEIEFRSTRKKWHRSIETTNPIWIRPHHRPIPNPLSNGTVHEACPTVPDVYARSKQKNGKWEWETSTWRIDKKRSRQIEIGEMQNVMYKVS